MKESDLTAGLSWKRGFLTNKSQGNNSTKALPQAKAEKIPKIQCPRVEKTQNKLQRNLFTGEAVLSSTDLAMATDPAPSSLQHVTIATEPIIGTCQGYCPHDPTVSDTTCTETVPQISLKHNDSHIHCTSPVCGLPLEKQHIEGKSDKHNDHEGGPSFITEETLVVDGHSLIQPPWELRHPLPIATDNQSNTVRDRSPDSSTTVRCQGRTGGGDAGY